MAKEFSFSDLNKSINSISENGGLFSESDHATIKDWISTGNYALNACISGDIFKGVPASRFTALPGESGVGKSFLCLNIAKQAQEKGYFIIYFDSENAVDPETTARFGIDPEMFRHEPVSTFKEVANLITNICKSLSDKKKDGFEIPKVYMFLDSLSMLASTKEMNDTLSGSEKKDMTKGQDVRSLFGTITSAMGKLGIGMTYTTHTYTAVGSFIPMQVMKGGGGAIYSASVIVMLTKAQLKEDGKTKSGIVVSAKPQKSRFCKPNVIKFHISFYRGMNPYVGLEPYIDFDNIGIQIGEFKPRIIEEPVLNPDGTPVIYRGKPKVNRIVSDEMIFTADPAGKKVAVKHLGTEVPLNELFTDKVFTKEVLELINETKIKPLFELPNVDQVNSESLIESFGLDEDEFGQE